MSDIFHGIGAEVLLTVHKEEGSTLTKGRAAFLKVAETLTRIGDSYTEEDGSNVLMQVCYILHKRGRYVIAHANEMMSLDDPSHVVLESDIAVRNRVATLLDNWGLVELVRDDEEEREPVSVGGIKIIPFRDKTNWHLMSPYNIGKRDRRAYA